MKLSALLSEVKTLNAFADVEIEGVTDKDSEVKKGTLFVCINGDSFDGHLRAQKALQNGAAAVIAERDLGLLNQVLVENSRTALSKTASDFYKNPAESLKLIGITGTNGKTSTAFFIRDILQSLGKKCGIIGTVINNDGSRDSSPSLTTPEPMELQRLFRDMADNGCEYCVMEVSSQALSQQRVSGLRFSAAALTNITPEHLDYHRTMEAYISAKLSLFENADTAVVNYDDKTAFDCIEKIPCPVHTFSIRSNRADYTAKSVELSADGVKYLLVGTDCIERMSVPVAGSFTVYNSMCAAAVLLQLGFDLPSIAKAAASLEPVKGRAERVLCPSKALVMIDYAHTPDGLSKILSCVREFTKGRVITLFGCGGDRDKKKRPLMGKIAGEKSDWVIVTTDNPRTENPLLIINDILAGMEKSKAKIIVIENRREAIEYALKKAEKDDCLLLAGKGHENYQIIGSEKIPFDERKIIKEFYS